MAYRHIYVENPAKIFLRDAQIIIVTNNVSHRVPLEDMATLLVENRQTVISAASLSALAQNHCTVYLCDEKHMPCALLTPFAQHSRAPVLLRLQMECPEPLKKRLWQSVVRQKISNQAACLSLNGNEEGAAAICGLVAKVRSGDTGNQEAVAAARYFPLLFWDTFTRDGETPINAALNYGYAIMRGCVARCVASAGFIPALGLHHHSGLNAFNLADDLMEPFRPLVDVLVATCSEFHGEELTTDGKKFLFALLTAEMVCDGKKQTAANAAELLVNSLARSLQSGENQLVLPVLENLRFHPNE